MIGRIGLLLLVFSIGVLSGALWRDYRCFLNMPIQGPEAGVILDVQKGTSLRALANRMTEQGLLDHPYYFTAMAYLQGDQSRLKAGEYALTSGMTPPEVLARLISGRVVEYSVTLVEGRTFRQALAVIDAHEVFGGANLASLSDEELMSRLGRSGEHPEGRFFPDTYRFPRQTTGMDILKRAMERLDGVLAEEWEQRAPNLPIQTPYEALILASIIEKETALPDERPRIGGVFVRRLQKGMRLQTDPTVIYGMGERFDGNIRRADLREATPYNTYVIDGLPPTPIALVGREAIRAALRPEEGDLLYFVARGDGGHVFSRTLDEHNQAVRRYILNQGP
ncbi:endolytic transglycosylase MltG [Thiocystis violacea]|uniref:endolytic transglycosylase MltG n=1 Tax=Thiocystis violacea TaxID=13725 RepID=UPI001905D8C1|nr:endolytic transglycosylase MltG [Thiocystis violacea]MBK1719472.1 aminodeoxychorismate lyase [Thiocystis violacea]